MAALITFEEVIDNIRLLVARYVDLILIPFDIYYTLRTNPYRNGIAAIRMAKLAFSDIDSQDSGKIESEEFFGALLKSKLFLSKHETSCLFRHYKSKLI